jgi:hypothetical protein
MKKTLLILIMVLVILVPNILATNSTFNLTGSGTSWYGDCKDNAAPPLVDKTKLTDGILDGAGTQEQLVSISNPGTTPAECRIDLGSQVNIETIGVYSNYNGQPAANEALKWIDFNVSTDNVTWIGILSVINHGATYEWINASVGAEYRYISIGNLRRQNAAAYGAITEWQVIYSIPTVLTLTTIYPLNRTYNLAGLDNKSYNGLINISCNTNCSLVSVNDTRWVTNITNPSNFTLFNSNYSNLNNGEYHINISTNSTGEGNASALVIFRIDDISPDAVSNIDNTTFTTQNFTAQINYTDNSDLYSFNVSLDNNLFDSKTALSGTLFVYNLTVTPENLSTLGIGNERINITTTVCDSHTDKEIKSFNIREVNNKIYFDDIFIEGNSVSDITYKRLKDRYTFSFEYSSPKYSINLEVPESCDYIEHSKYQGHFVCGNKWIDFEGDYFVQVNNNKVKITSIYPRTKWEFNSVGELNCNSFNLGFYDTFNTTVISVNQSLEGVDQEFVLQIDCEPGVGNTTANLIFNNTSYSTTRSDGTGQSNFTVLLTMPNATELNFTKFEFYFNYTINDINIERTTNPANVSTYIPQISNCSLYGLPTLNLTFLHQENNSAVFVDFEGAFDLTLQSRNYSYGINNASEFDLCIFPLWATFRTDAQFQYDGFNYNLWNFNLTNSTSEITLYTQDGTTQVEFTVLDQNNNRLENVIIKVLKYDIGTNSFQTTEILNTDYLGVALGNIILNTEWYKFILELDGEIILETTQTIITSTSRTFRVVIGSDYFAEYDVVNGIASSLTFSNATKIFTFTYSDPTGDISQGCLRVIKRTFNGDTTVNDTCVSSAASTILVNIGTDTGNNMYLATGYVHFSDEFILKTLSVQFNELWKTYGQDGILFSFLFNLGLVMFGVFNPIVSISFLIIGFLITNLMGAFHLNWAYLIGFVLLSFIVIYKLGKSE